MAYTYYPRNWILSRCLTNPEKSFPFYIPDSYPTHLDFRGKINFLTCVVDCRNKFSLLSPENSKGGYWWKVLSCKRRALRLFDRSPIKATGVWFFLPWALRGVTHQIVRIILVLILRYPSPRNICFTSWLLSKMKETRSGWPMMHSRCTWRI